MKNAEALWPIVLPAFAFSVTVYVPGASADRLAAVLSAFRHEASAPLEFVEPVHEKLPGPAIVMFHPVRSGEITPPSGAIVDSLPVMLCVPLSSMSMYLLTLSAPQLLTLMLVGAAKSLIAELNASDERLLS